MGAPGVGQWELLNSTIANERGAHVTGRNPAKPRCGVAGRADQRIQGSHPSPRLFDAPNAEARRSASDAAAGPDRSTGPRACRGTAKSCATGQQRCTRRGWIAEALKARRGISRMSGPLGISCGQLGPDVHPVVWSKLSPRHHATQLALYACAVLDRNATDLPVTDCADRRQAQTSSKNITTTKQACRRINWVLTRPPESIRVFHSLNLTRYVFASQHHDTTHIVLN